MNPLYDPEGFRTRGHAVVDRLANHLARMLAGEGPAHPALDPVAEMAAFREAMPAAPAADPDAALLAAVDLAIARTMHNHHPRCMGHQVAAPMPTSVLADLVAAMLNQGMAVFETGQIGVMIERQTVRWLNDAIGWGPEADGVFTSGGSLGNLTALLAARNVAGAEGGPLHVLVSEQAHYSIARAGAILGLGPAGVVPVAADAACRMDVAALAREADAIEARGGRVAAVVGSACTTSTGSYDPLPAIAALCRARGYWLHIDGAHGASVLLSPRYRHLAAGIELADSVVWDAHKLLSVPSLATAVLFRNGRDNYAAFSQEAAYLFGPDAEAAYDLGLRSVECTKRMLAFKLWLALRVHGADAVGELVAGMHDRARDLAERLREAPDFELWGEPASNIVCFRHRPAGLDDGEDLDRHQEALRARAIASGAAYLVQTKLKGRVWLRVTLMSPATGAADLDALLDGLRTGHDRVAGRLPGHPPDFPKLPEVPPGFS